MKKYIKFSIYQLFQRICRVNRNSAYFESHASSDMGGNMYYIARELLNKQYHISKIYISVNSKNELPRNIEFLQKENLGTVKIVPVIRRSIANYYALSISKYLFTDVTIINSFVKRKEQIVVQTWHGTPLKNIGFDYVNDISFTSEQMKSFAIADYILFPNRYTMEHMVESYRLENVVRGKILLSGYPRNSAFFDHKSANNLKREMGLQNKQIFVYMPTWRGTLHNAGSTEMQVRQLQSKLEELDEKLQDGQILYAKLHRLNRVRIDFKNFQHILPFPSEYESYQFLALADCLITDYSNVMFDFLCTRKKIILFTYDKREYLDRQGTYISIDDLPFPQVETVSELAKELNLPKNYDDAKVYEKFCPYDSIRSASQLCNTVITEKNECEIKYFPSNGKENVLLYCGGLSEGTTTLNFYNYIDNLDLEARNYFVLYRSSAFIHAQLRLLGIAKPINLIGIDYEQGEAICPTLAEHLILKIAKKHPKTIFIFRKKIQKMYQRELRRQCCEIVWDEVIRFGGLDAISLGFTVFTEAKKKAILLYDELIKQANKDSELALYLDLAESHNCSVIRVTRNEFLHPMSDESDLLGEKCL